MAALRPTLSILFVLILTVCYVPVAVVTDKHPSPLDSGGSGEVDTGHADTQDTGIEGDSGDSGDSNTLETGDTTSSGCQGCEGVLSISSSEVSIKADGTDEGTAEVDISGWTTGLELACAETLGHLTWTFDTTDTSSTGAAKLTFGVTGFYRGKESGVCALTSDYGRAFYLEVVLDPCPECTGITGCATDELVIWAGYPWTGGSSNLACGGTATGIEVTCTGFDTDPTFYARVDTDDSSSSAVFMLTVGTATEGLTGSGTCTLSSEQEPTVDICVWKCTVSGCLSPC